MGDKCFFFVMNSGRGARTPGKLKVFAEMTVGSYVLQIDVARPLLLSLRGEGLRLPPGRYLYCGSAHGPGGVEARVSRHRKREKPLHWHIDQVTCQVGVGQAGYCDERSECDFVSEILRLKGASVPIPEFGSSDCRSCPAHFIQAPDSFDLLSLNLKQIPAV